MLTAGRAVEGAVVAFPGGRQGKQHGQAATSHRGGGGGGGGGAQRAVGGMSC